MNTPTFLADLRIFAAGHDTQVEGRGGVAASCTDWNGALDEPAVVVERRSDPDAGLVVDIRAGDERAFSTLFDRYVERMIVFATTLTHDRTASHDIVADVFFALWRIRETWCPDRVAVYLFGAVRNRCYNYKMSLLTRRETPLDVVEHAAMIDPRANGGDSALDAATLFARVETILATQPPQRRAVALLRWREEFGFAEIADSLGISENAARLHVSRALAVLRHLLPDER